MSDYPAPADQPTEQPAEQAPAEQPVAPYVEQSPAEQPQYEQPALFDSIAVNPDDADDADDLGAEVDESVPADTDGQPAYAPDDEGALTGVCIDGPYQGRTVTTRTPAGFVLVDKAHKVEWVYRANPDKAMTFTADRGGKSAPMTDVDDLSDGALDVIAYDDGPA